jgi:hypothetical protein
VYGLLEFLIKLWKIQKILKIVNFAIQVGGEFLLPKNWLAHGNDKRYSLFEFTYEKFTICCIYDKISPGFYRVEILRKAYENVTFFSVGAVLASL